MRWLSTVIGPEHDPTLKPFVVWISLGKGGYIKLPECGALYQHPAADFHAVVWATSSDDVKRVLEYHWSTRLLAYTVEREGKQ